MLAERVAAGELPPVDERLPENPHVFPVTTSIGKYGGTFRRGFNGLADRHGIIKYQIWGLTHYNEDLTLRAGLCESWDLSDDGTTFTWHLRPGLKWSDGTPFTSAAFSWFWDNVLKHETLTTAPPAIVSTGSPRVLGELETPDEFTVIMRFAHPNPLLVYTVEREEVYRPGHYLEQFHADFVPAEEIAEKVAQADMPDWESLFNDRATWTQNPELPNIYPWLASTPLSVEIYVQERNPYFWQVDAEGQQLPYVDRITHRLFESVDVFNMWVVNGEIDIQERHVSIGNYTLFKENEQNGDYQVYNGIAAQHATFAGNMTSQNPVLREFFGDRRVRIAISHAVDRDAMNNLIYDGMATPRQYSPVSVSPQYYPKLSNAYLEYDPDQANALLDEAGYTEKDSEGFRLAKDGSELSFVIEGTWQPGAVEEDAVNMAISYYRAVGIKASYKYVDRSLFEEHLAANLTDASWWGGDRSILPLSDPAIFLGTNVYRPFVKAWSLWYQNPTNPVGEEPPEGHWYREILRLWGEVAAEPDPNRQNELFFQLLDIWAEELPMVGYLGEFPAPVIVKNGLVNYKPGMAVDTQIKSEHVLGTPTYYWEEPELHA